MINEILYPNNKFCFHLSCPHQVKNNMGKEKC